MNKTIQASVRLMTEEMVDNSTDDMSMNTVAVLEVARQIALLTDEMKKMNKKSDEAIELLRSLK